MSEFAVTITCRLNEDDSELTSFILDTVNDTNVTSSSIMTTHPIVTGDLVSDHIYNNPDSLSISGVFSLNGSKGIVINQEGIKLESVQNLFEKIKRNGILCNIVKVHNVDSKDIRFKLHSNMVLTNISWVERENSLGFTFSFTQAMLAEIKEYEIKTDDKFLPDITEPATLNFTDTLINWEEIDKALIKCLQSFDLITDEFLSMLSGLGEAALISLGVAVGTAILVAKLVSVGLVSGPVGWIIVGIGAAIGAAYGIYKLISNAIKRNKYKIQQFKKYESDAKNKKEVERFCNFEGEIHKNIAQLNNAIKVYNIGSNTPQECMLTIDNKYYIFTFERNNTTNKYSLVIKDIEDKNVGQLLDITACPEDFSQLTSENKIFRAAEGGSYVYIICPDEDKSTLLNYYIVVSSMNLDDYNEAVSKIIKNALVY